MSKTITMRLDDETYSLFKRAADGDRRSISNYIEFATLNFIARETFVTDEEMDLLGADKNFASALRKAEEEIAAGKYRIVE